MDHPAHPTRGIQCNISQLYIYAKAEKERCYSPCRRMRTIYRIPKSLDYAGFIRIILLIKYRIALRRLARFHCTRM